MGERARLRLSLARVSLEGVQSQTLFINAHWPCLRSICNKNGKSKDGRTCYSNFNVLQCRFCNYRRQSPVGNGKRAFSKPFHFRVISISKMRKVTIWKLYPVEQKTVWEVATAPASAGTLFFWSSGYFLADYIYFIWYFFHSNQECCDTFEFHTFCWPNLLCTLSMYHIQANALFLLLARWKYRLFLSI